jgi:hypothetical protein
MGMAVNFITAGLIGAILGQEWTAERGAERDYEATFEPLRKEHARQNKAAVGKIQELARLTRAGMLDKFLLSHL